MKLKILTSKNVDLAVVIGQANKLIQIMLQDGYEADRINIDEENNVFSKNEEYTLRLYFEKKNVPKLRKVSSVSECDSMLFAKNTLEQTSQDEYIDMDFCKHKRFLRRSKVSGVVLY